MVLGCCGGGHLAVSSVCIPGLGTPCDAHRYRVRERAYLSLLSVRVLVCRITTCIFVYYCHDRAAIVCDCSRACTCDQQITPVVASQGPRHVTVADFDGVSPVDVLVVWGDTTAYLHLRNASGIQPGYNVTATPSQISPLSSLSVAIADFDSDGRNDFFMHSLAAGSYGGGAPIVCGNSGSSAAGLVTFSCTTVPASYFSSGLLGLVFVTADLNGDNRHGAGDANRFGFPCLRVSPPCLEALHRPMEVHSIGRVARVWYWLLVVLVCGTQA